jgi:hypothetical protein
LTAKKQPKQKKDGLPEDKTIYPTTEDVIRINRAVLGELPPEEMEKLPGSTRKRIEQMAKQFKPRPTARIREILTLLEELWLKQPDQRLGQFLLNTVYRNADHRDETSIKMYAQEDDLTLDFLKKLKSVKGF